MSYLEQEIKAQPTILANLIQAEADNVKAIANAIQKFNPSFVMIAARGTSDNAARYAQYLMSIHANLPVALATPSVHTLYESPPHLNNALVIGISQSGQSVDVGKVVQDAREQGALTITITNDPESPMAQSAHHHLPLRCGEEISVAATKTYTAQLTTIAMLVCALTNQARLREQLEKVPQWTRETLEKSQGIAGWIERYRYIERIASIGRGYNYCTAFEVSLKIKELCYITGEEYSEADFRHGPIAMIQSGFPVLVVAPNGKPLPLLVNLLEHLHKQKAECLVISNDETAHRYAKKSMHIPKGVPEWLSPICSVIPGQVFAMRLALVKGHTIDKPEGLTKVTITQ